MGLGHEKLDVYRLLISYVAWVYEKADGLTGNDRSARDQWLRASPFIPLNIAEGNGKTAEADRRRCFEIARGSVLECGAIQDVLVVGKALDEQESLVRKTELDRMAAMLSRLGGRGYTEPNRRKSIPIPVPISISKRRGTIGVGVGIGKTNGNSIPIPIPTPTPMTQSSQ
jgi:four helix bundle protein